MPFPTHKVYLFLFSDAMASQDWSIYELGNYDGSVVTGIRPKAGVSGIPKPSWVKRWAREGMRRTVRAVLMVHSNDVPHILVFQQKTEQGTVPFLFGGKLSEGESEKDGMARLMKSFIMKTKSEDVCEWRIGESIGKFWRPEFDENLYPYVPQHVTRPKEEIMLFQVVLPPKCVFALRKGMAITAVPVHEIMKSGNEMGPLISSLPSIVSRFTFYNYVGVSRR